MYKELLIELISILKERDYKKATEHLEVMKETRDVGLLSRAECIMSVFDWIYADSEEKKQASLELFYNSLELINALKKDNEKYDLGYNFYDDFDVENLFTLINETKLGVNYGTA